MIIFLQVIPDLTIYLFICILANISDLRENEIVHQQCDQPINQTLNSKDVIKEPFFFLILYLDKKKSKNQ